MKIYLHICEMLWVLSHTVYVNYSLQALKTTEKNYTFEVSVQA